MLNIFKGNNKKTESTYPVCIVVQNDKVSVAHIESWQMITSIFGIKDVFINHIGCSSCFWSVSTAEQMLTSINIKLNAQDSINIQHWDRILFLAQHNYTDACCFSCTTITHQTINSISFAWGAGDTSGHITLTSSELTQSLLQSLHSHEISAKSQLRNHNNPFLGADL